MPDGSQQYFNLDLASETEDAGLQFFSSLDKTAKNFVSLNKEEGQLCVDVAQTADEIIVVATMAGTPPDKLELHLHNDLLTIRGERFTPVPVEAEYYLQETFWGKFSRSIVLPMEVKHELTKADYKNGILTVHLPKMQTGKTIPITVVEE